MASPPPPPSSTPTSIKIKRKQERLRRERQQQQQQPRRKQRRGHHHHHYQRRAASSSQSSLGMPIWLATATLFCALYYCYFTWKSQTVLESELEHRSLWNDLSSKNHHQKNASENIIITNNNNNQSDGAIGHSLPAAAAPPSITNKTYIMFEAFPGQGIGNHMNGLLAAHMLGKEFNRTVCVTPEWEDFHKAFYNPKHQEECQKLPPSSIPSRRKNGEAITSSIANSTISHGRIAIISFGAPPDECKLKDDLSNQDIQVWYLTCNTYPRWASVQPNFWDEFYEITPLLQQYLPWNESSSSQPTTVVHLRAPDSKRGDPRKGLDDLSLRILGETFGAKNKNNTTTTTTKEDKPFLVTNNVDWYDYFHTNFGWSNPGWNQITHSVSKTRKWGSVRNMTSSSRAHHLNDTMMQLWADWYTILKAKKVLHTHSDFSLSAIHWRQLDSKTLFGTVRKGGRSNDVVLNLIDEPWRREPEMIPLIEREGKELAHCPESPDAATKPKGVSGTEQKLSRERKVIKSDSLKRQEDGERMSKSNDNSNSQNRYIMVLPFDEGQGIGNYMNGLLAAHMLGKEFGRIVCVSKEWTDFHKAFRSRNHHEECSKLFIQQQQQQQQHGLDRQTLSLVNYLEPVNECLLKSQLSNTSIPIWFFKGNTYPRWAPVEPNFWNNFYEITPQLQSYLPWKDEPPTTVVHLRQPDSEGMDPRKGLDDESLEVLGKTLIGPDTFLVTNNVDWYDYFKTNFQWSNPGWQQIKHSATDQVWGTVKNTTAGGRTDSSSHRDPMMELWADWYTILQAKRVFHTHSDFSLSAIHWRQLESHTLVGTKQLDNEKKEIVLDLVDEPWRRDEVMVPLVERKGDGLANCDKSVNNLLFDESAFQQVDMDADIDDDIDDDHIEEPGRKEQQALPPPAE